MRQRPDTRIKKERLIQDRFNQCEYKLEVAIGWN